ncbi:MAG TPA: aldose epimerase [Bacteroidetes bacterium]|jgi:galactose mutarotase-like enzyme|nr:aldose epimerase [Bacteroidota bacterium]
MISKYSIQNKFLTVNINRLGAELCSVIDSEGTEFIWQAGEVWPKHAPNLFPIVGSLLDHEYTYQGETYSLSHHGFARNKNFELLHQSEHSVCLVLQHDEETLHSYPFKFTFLITYTLEANNLSQTFRVINDDDRTLPVSFGGHPGFNASPINDFEIIFSEKEFIKSNQLSGPYINENEIDIIQTDRISMDKTIFDNDALIFQGLNSKEVSLQKKNSTYAVKMNIDEFPYLGIWAKPGAPYVCLEPWQGLADYLDHNKNIEHKKGIILLPFGEEIEKIFRMTFTS